VTLVCNQHAKKELQRCADEFILWNDIIKMVPVIPEAKIPLSPFKDQYEEDILALDKKGSKSNPLPQGKDSKSNKPQQQRPKQQPLEKPIEFPCPECGRVFQDYQSLHQHQTSTKHSNVWRCKVCQKEFQSFPSLSQHLQKTGHSTKKKEKPGKKDHKKTESVEHPGDSKGIGQGLGKGGDEPKGKGKGKGQGKGEKKAKNVKQSDSSNGVRIEWICLACQVKFGSENSLQKHLQVSGHFQGRGRQGDRGSGPGRGTGRGTEIQNEDNKLDDASELFVCQMCQSEFAFEVALRQHQRDTGHPQSTRKESGRGKKNKDRGRGRGQSKKDELKSDNDSNESDCWECLECQSEFSSEMSLQQHLQKTGHLDEFWRCTDCGREFETVESLKQHGDHAHGGSRDHIYVCRNQSCSFYGRTLDSVRLHVEKTGHVHHDTVPLSEVRFE